jgi:hypothetical protein
MAGSVTQSTAGAGTWVEARRECLLVCSSADWAGETATIEYQTPGGAVATLRDSAGNVAFTGNDGKRVPGGVKYRMNKASTKTVTMELVDSLAASQA